MRPRARRTPTPSARAAVAAALALALVVAAVAREAGAQPAPDAGPPPQPAGPPPPAPSGAGPVHLAWVRGEGAEDCPGPAALAAAVARQLGRAPFAPEAPRSIEAVASRQGGRYVARIFVRDPRGALAAAREIRSDDASCAALGEAAALAIALAIDPEAALRARPPDPPPPRRAPAPRRRPASRPPAPPPRPPPDASATARFVVALGLLPAVSPGFALATDARIWGPLRWTASLAVFPEVGTPPPDANFAFGLATASLGACVQPVEGAVVRLAGCAAIQAGAIHAVVRSLAPVTPGDYPFVAASLAIRAAFRVVGPLRLELGIEGLALLYRHQFDVMGRPDAPAFVQPPLAGAAYLGAGVHFW